MVCSLSLTLLSLNECTGVYPCMFVYVCVDVFWCFLHTQMLMSFGLNFAFCPLHHKNLLFRSFGNHKILLRIMKQTYSCRFCTLICGTQGTAMSVWQVLTSTSGRKISFLYVTFVVGADSNHTWLLLFAVATSWSCFSRLARSFQHTSSSSSMWV